MTSGVEITSSIKVPLDQPGLYGSQFYTTYPLSDTVVNNECGVLPYMARVHSPVRISRTPATMGMKRKSRVTDTTKSAIFNYKPLRRSDHTSMLKFRAPDATLPTLQYISPWISVTKTDYQDPRFSGDFSNSTDIPLGLFGRSYTDVSIDLSRKNTPSMSRSDSLRKSDISSQQRQRASITRETSAKTVSSQGKRVHIVEPNEETEIDEEMRRSVLEVVNSSPIPPVKTKLTDLKEPKSSVNYYSGYLPPELSDEIAEKLKISNEASNASGSDKKAAHSSLRAQFYKPLVGDRTLYMHESYPTQPKIIQSDIDQMRLASRKRFLQSHGQVPVHFSALKNYGSTNRTQQRGARLDEAVREQQRQTQSAKPTRQPVMATSLEGFQQQRDRTYHLQNLAREMINK